MNISPFLFRGTRNYVLGADVLYTVLDSLHRRNTAKNIDYTVKQACTTQSIKLIPAQEASTTEQLKAVGVFIDNVSNVLILPHGKKIEERTVCIDAEIAQHFTYSTEDSLHPEVYFNSSFENTPLIHTLVVAFKYLLNKKFVSDQRSYSFARLKLDNLDIEQFSIRYIRFFANRFFEGHIFSQEKQIGAIYFGGQNT